MANSQFKKNIECTHYLLFLNNIQIHYLWHFPAPSMKISETTKSADPTGIGRYFCHKQSRATVSLTHLNAVNALVELGYVHLSVLGPRVCHLLIKFGTTA
jgi:hypothetical protein